MNYQQPQHARNAKYQTAGKYDEVIAFIGSEAEPYNKIGLQLVLDAKKAEANYKPVLIGKKELAQLPNVRLLPVQNNCKLLSLYQLGELTEAQKTLVAMAIAHHTPNVKTAKLYDSAMQETEDFSGYIERIRNEQENEEILAHLQAKNDSQQIKTQPYFDEREVNGINGIYYIIPKIDKDAAEVVSEKEKWTCEPLTLKGEGYTENGEAFYMFEFTHPSRGKSQIEAIPLVMFGKSSGWEVLQKYGVKMTNESHLNKLADYFHFNGNHATKWTITEKTGWHNEAYLLPNGEILGTPHTLVYFRNRDEGKNAYAFSGTVESWRNNVGNYLRKNPFMMLAVATALASPLLKPLKAKSFGVHLYNDSTKGKTTALNIANSVWGNPEDLDQKWNQTPVAMMNNAQSRNDNFLTLDEIGQVKNFDDLEGTAYLLFNETGRTRGKKDGGNQQISKWKITALSTGEIDLEGFLQSKGRNIQAGSLVRLLNIPMEEAREWHGLPNAKAHADHLNEQVTEHYGSLGREWINFIMTNKGQIKPTFKHYLNLWLERLPSEADGQLQRVVNNFAILETALQLAGHLTGWSEEENREAISKAFNGWIKVFGTRSKEETNITENFNNWLLSAQHNEFFEVKFEANGEPVIRKHPYKEVSGYYFLADEHFVPKEHFFIFPNAFKRQTIGKAKEVALRALAGAKMLDDSLENESRPYQKRLSQKLDKSRPFCYVVYKLEEEDG
ncbi:DUF927 domain-containing protein [Actinobacillus pleuropneumoniae]|uniref:DUF927 domain-containing protein n=1 Tax=Actinobacillus pleuropneumoniae TaxID=715 RepID=UPI001F15BDBF|nr:DUF927 domain-containing protein [Actinobacillus pleuropneumoniae]UKH19983.1 DUF927 domain-containing protein [Actinobacillus pleuropneumoniae]UPA21796.1 DUF927 domain-containing protein [Actinobacillus pleuropneumoniae]